MENKKVFIGNLDFEVTENEVKNLLSKYGTVVSIKMHQKKGYAFVEMGDAAEAAKAVQKLDGVKYRDREIRISIEMKAGKAKSVSVKRYKERGQSFSQESSRNDSDTKSRSGKFRNTLKHKPNDKAGNSGSTYRERSSGSEERQSGENRKERQGLPRPERDRWATERPSDSQQPPKKEWSGEKPSHSRPSRDENRGGYGSYGRSFEKSVERSSASGNRPLKDYTKESSGSPRAPRREWTPEKPSHPGRTSRDGERSSQGRSPKPGTDYRSREKASGSDERPSGDYSRERTGSQRPAKREWTPEKPSYHGKPSRDGEKSGSSRPPRKEWSSDKPSRPSRETSDSWKEKPERKEYQGDKPRDYSKPRSVSGSQNRVSRSSGSKPGAGRGSSRPGSGDGSRDRNRRSGRE